MKIQSLVTALAAAFALPAVAADAPKAEKHFHRYEFQIDTDGILADATSAMKDAEQWRQYGEHMREWAQDFTDEMHGSMTYMFSDRVGRGRLVKGAPYSADAVTEMNQALSDGNVITHKTVSRVYRDSEGRTRQESMRGDETRSVYISDPVAGVSYTLMPKARIAVSIPRIERLERGAPRADGKMSSETQTLDNERRIIVRNVDGSDLPGTREEVRVQVVRIGDKDLVLPTPPNPPTAPTPPAAPRGFAPVPPLPPIPPIAPIPGVHTMRFESTAGLGKGVTSRLGTKEFDGVKAEGTSTVWTIPAGQVGNRNPINVTKEAWYSPELQVTVMTRYNDPRTGESIYRLASIKRNEPSIDLFKVPEGYSLKGRSKRDSPPEPAKAPG